MIYALWATACGIWALALAVLTGALWISKAIKPPESADTGRPPHNVYTRTNSDR